MDKELSKLSANKIKTHGDTVSKLFHTIYFGLVGINSIFMLYC